MAAQTTATTTEEAIAALSTALAARDREAVAAAFAPDAVFSPSIGGDAVAYHGAEAAADGLFVFLGAFGSGQFESVRRVFAGDEAYAEWRFVGLSKDGEEVVVHGCDYFLVRDGKVAIKNAFRKQS